MSRAFTIADEVEEAVLSKLSSDAIRIWIWLRLYNPDGAGLGVILANFDESCESLFELEEAGLIQVDVDDPAVLSSKWTEQTSANVAGPRQRPAESLRSKDSNIGNNTSNTNTDNLHIDAAPRGKSNGRTRVHIHARSRTIESLRGVARVRAAFAAPDLRISKETIGIASARVFQFYNEARRRQGIGVIHESQQASFDKYLRSIAEFEAMNDVDLGEFFRFAYTRTRFQQTRFPTLSVCAGPWLRDEWFNRSRGKTGPKHAGHTYRAPGEATREFLVASGVEEAVGWEDATVRYVEDQAKAFIDLPHLTEIDPEYEGAVRLLIKKFQDGA